MSLMKSAALRGTLALALLLGGCSEKAPDHQPAISEDDRALGAEQHPQLLAEFGGAYEGPEAAYVARLGAQMAEAAGLGGQCRFTLVNSDVVNAFAVPGCYIYLTRGLMTIVTSEAELASVLGHEVGHIVAAHSERQQRRSLWQALGVLAVSVTGSQILTRIAGEAAQYFGLRYSRGQEYEADDLSIRYLQAAGYDPYASAEMLTALARQEAFMQRTRGHDDAHAIPEWARSHPLTENRIERTREAARATGLADDELPEKAPAYLAEVDGLLYGDDPEQGFVLGRRFAHPVMRITFEAPEGFTLSNSPQAIQLNGPEGLRGEFGGGRLAGSVEAYAEALTTELLGSGEHRVVSAERLSVNGLPAAIIAVDVAGREGTMRLAIAAYDGGGGQAYHFIMAMPQGGAGAEAVAALFRSFRLMSPQEATTLRPRVVRVVTAPPGTSEAALISQVSDPHAAALFRMLNGLDEGETIRPGQPVKLVVRVGGVG